MRVQSGCTTRTDVIQTFQLYNNDSGAPPTSRHLQIHIRLTQIGYRPIVLFSTDTYSTPPEEIWSTSDCMSTSSNISYAPIDTRRAIGAWSSTADLSPLEARLPGQTARSGKARPYYAGRSDSLASRSQLFITELRRLETSAAGARHQMACLV